MMRTKCDYLSLLVVFLSYVVRPVQTALITAFVEVQGADQVQSIHYNEGQRLRRRTQDKGRRRAKDSKSSTTSRSRQESKSSTTSRSKRTESKSSKSAKQRYDFDPDFNNQRDQTSSPTASPVSEDFRFDSGPDFNDGIPSVRTIHIEHSSRTGYCMAYDDTTSGSRIIMSNCADPFASNRWELLDVTPTLFKIRHAQTQLCLPQNPETPEAAFDCFSRSGNTEALADSINDLVDCESSHAATLGFVDSMNPMYLYNESCFSGSSPGLGSDVGLMSYTAPSGTILVLWGEKVLLEMQNMVQEYNLSAEWVLVDVS